MLEKEQRYVDALRSELAKSNEPKLLQELKGAERRVGTLQDQLVNLTMHAEHEVRYIPTVCLKTLSKPKKLKSKLSYDTYIFLVHPTDVPL
jgi:predicted  nucleic acid-binding Zn-ribbon protein